MSLHSASSANRVTDQGNTYSWTLDPAIQDSKIQAVTAGSTLTVGESVSVVQWRVTAHLAKRYRYVGLSKAAAEWISEEASSMVTIRSQPPMKR